MTYQCPLCGARFRFVTELAGHARDEHQPVTVEERQERIVRYRESGRPTRGAVHVPL